MTANTQMWYFYIHIIYANCYQQYVNLLSFDRLRSRWTVVLFAWHDDVQIDCSISNWNGYVSVSLFSRIHSFTAFQTRFSTIIYSNCRQSRTMSCTTSISIGHCRWKTLVSTRDNSRQARWLHATIRSINWTKLRSSIHIDSSKWSRHSREILYTYRERIRCIDCDNRRGECVFDDRLNTFAFSWLVFSVRTEMRLNIVTMSMSVPISVEQHSTLIHPQKNGWYVRR